MKTYTLNQLKDEFIGKFGTAEREQYEYELKLDVLGELIKQTRKQKNLTQDELGTLIGVNKSEISKLENNARNMKIGTLIKVFNALKANIKFRVELENQDWSLA